MRVPGAAKAIDNLLKWSAREEWDAYRTLVINDHLDLVCDQLGTTAEEIDEVLGPSIGPYFDCVLEDFFCARFGDNGEINVIDEYLKQRGWREKVPAKRYLQALRDSYTSLYEVIDVDPGRGMTLRDMVLGGDPVVVSEESGSKSAVKWDRIAARVVVVNNVTLLTGAVLVFRKEAAEQLLSLIEQSLKKEKARLRREARKRGDSPDIGETEIRKVFLHACACVVTEVWLADAFLRATAPLPELRNSDGHEIVFSETRFPVTGEVPAIAAVLDGLDMLERESEGEPRWVWLADGGPARRSATVGDIGIEADDRSGLTILGHVELRDDLLVLTTNSKERAETGRELLRRPLQGLVGTPLTSLQTMEQARAENSGSKPGKPDPPADAMDEILHAFLDNHYRETLDTPIPALGGKTPRKAARSKAGRAQVTRWLKDVENAETRRAARDGQKPYDVSWMWRELKIDPD